MTGQLHHLELDGALLVRGFWLYVCEIRTDDGRTLHYVGKTGDKAAGVSQSPFNRLSKHLGSNKHSNAMLRHLQKLGLDPERCRFRFVAFGPLFSGEASIPFAELCDVTSGLEKALASAMTASGYEVINTVRHRKTVDQERFAPIWTAFAQHFPPR